VILVKTCGEVRWRYAASCLQFETGSSIREETGLIGERKGKPGDERKLIEWGHVYVIETEQCGDRIGGYLGTPFTLLGKSKDRCYRHKGKIAMDRTDHSEVKGRGTRKRGRTKRPKKKRPDVVPKVPSSVKKKKT